MNINISVSSTAAENGRKAAVKAAELINKAITGMTSFESDPFTEYMDAKEAQDENKKVSLVAEPEPERDIGESRQRKGIKM